MSMWSARTGSAAAARREWAAVAETVDSPVSRFFLAEEAPPPPLALAEEASEEDLAGGAERLRGISISL